MVLVDVHPRLLFAFTADAGTDDLTQAVNIKGFQPQFVLDFAAHALTPGFGTENARLQLQAFRGNAHIVHHFRQKESV